jgi:sugar/nucleoside kinase (ribokinase family)
VRFAGRVGAHDLARHEAALRSVGVDARLTGDEQAATGRTVVLAHDRSMFTDRGANLRLAADDLGGDLLDGVSLVHVSGYALFAEGPRRAVLDLVARAGVPWSVDPSSAAFLAGAPFLAWTTGAALCLPNEDEAQILGPGLAGAYEVVALKRGAAGARVLREGVVVAEVHAPEVDVVDLTGAGDAFAAGWLCALSRGEDDAGCADRGVEVAARALSRVGARP